MGSKFRSVFIFANRERLAKNTKIKPPRKFPRIRYITPARILAVYACNHVVSSMKDRTFNGEITRALGRAYLLIYGMYDSC